MERSSFFTANVGGLGNRRMEHPRRATRASVETLLLTSFNLLIAPFVSRTFDPMISMARARSVRGSTFRTAP